jgi:acetyltransferase-like isoleucine patch superfamily enzyme
MSLKEKIKANRRLKWFVHWAIVPSHQARPRKWVVWFVNPFYHKRGKRSIIRARTRIDVLPFNRFELGAYSIVEDFCTVNNGVGDVIIGNNTLVGMGNVIIGPVKIGDEVIFAQNVVLSGLNHNYEDIESSIVKQNVSTAPIVVQSECWIGANVVVTAGVVIGKHSVVAAGSIVTKNVPPYSVVVGNPARVIKRFDFQTNEWVRV